MQQDWLRRDGGSRLVIFALGWACDNRAVQHLTEEIDPCYDIMCLYDYRSIEPIDPSTMAAYNRRYLLAWSFGVWVAEQILDKIEFTRAVALGGTPLPVNDRYGIEPKRMAITIKGLRRHGLNEFMRRTYGQFYENYAPVSPGVRDLDANISELEALAGAASMPYTPSIRWNSAIVGSEDLIFPQENMVAYWGELAKIVPLPHYPFADARLITDQLDNR